MRKLITTILIITVALVVSCTPTISVNKVCQTNLDCVPAQCCHAADAVNTEHAPDCSSTICTLECAPGTIDCGQGSVACVEGSCRVNLNT